MEEEGETETEIGKATWAALAGFNAARTSVQLELTVNFAFTVPAAVCVLLVTRLPS